MQGASDQPKKFSGFKSMRFLETEQSQQPQDEDKDDFMRARDDAAANIGSQTFRVRTIPAVLNRQVSTPRTREVKNIVLNANKGYSNPNNVIGRTAREFYKEKQIELNDVSNKKQKSQAYLYRQVYGGVNVRLAKPHDN